MSVVAKDASVHDAAVDDDGGTKIPTGWFPFDGSCIGSKDADLKLVFKDGTTLCASAHLLAMLSPVIKTAVSDCDHSGTLSVESDDKRSWILLLNILHPIKSLTVSRDLDASDLAQLTCIAGIAQKYAVGHVHDFLDEIVAAHILKKKSEIGAQARQNDDYDGYGRHRAQVHRHPTLAKDDVVCSYAVFAARFAMESTLSACISYLAHIFASTPRFSCRSARSENETGPVLARLISRLSDEGFAVEGCKIASEVIKLLGSC